MTVQSRKITSSEAMEKLGTSISAKHKNVLLYGDLAAGKTTFVRGYVAGLGLDVTQVSSPTYAYINIYDDTVVHIDMYRLEEVSQLIEKGILDIILSYGHILIEWPKWTEQYAEGDWLTLKFEKDGMERRVTEG